MKKTEFGGNLPVLDIVRVQRVVASDNLLQFYVCESTVSRLLMRRIESTPSSCLWLWL